MGIVLTHNAKYKPLSFERLIQPYVMATEEYRLLEKGIADLDAEALELESLAAREEDRVNTLNKGKSDNEKISVDPWVNQYRAYAQSLKDKANALATKGLRHVNRKDLYNLQSTYKTNIRPTEEAIDYAKELAKEQRLKGDNIIFDNNYSLLGQEGGVSIQDIINSNNTLGYKSYDLDDVLKDSSTQAAVHKAGMTPWEDAHTNRDAYYYTHQGVDGKVLSSWKEKVSLNKGVITIKFTEEEELLEKLAKKQVEHLEGIVSDADYKRALAKAREGIAVGIVDTPVKTENKKFRYDPGLTSSQMASLTQSGYWYNPKTKRIEADPNNPIWISRGAYYDSKEGVWKMGIKPSSTPPLSEGDQDLKETQKIERRKKYWGNQNYVTDENGDRIPDPSDPSGYKRVYQVPSSSKDGREFKPIFIDLAGTAESWEQATAGFAGDDNSGALNLFDTSRKNRDWGSDFTEDTLLSTFNNDFEFKKIDVDKVPPKALEKIKIKFKEAYSDSWKDENWEFYTTGTGNEQEIVAVPKNYLKNYAEPSEGKQSIKASVDRELNKGSDGAERTDSIGQFNEQGVPYGY